MHSYYSAKHQPYQYYNYTIFVAEVASTFNEQLLSRHLMKRAKSDKERAYLINREIDAIRGTIIRQTMFAEFEKVTHATGRGGRAADGGVASRRSTASCCRLISGPDFAIDDELKLECLRIPHFYQRVLRVQVCDRPVGGDRAEPSACSAAAQAELNDYLSFLKGGCSK